jgi:hypothetical protein
MRRQVHRHTGNRRREVRAVIEVETSQVVLIGFALSTVLADDDAWNCLEYLAVPHDRPRVELACCDRALRCRLRDADQVLGRVFGIAEVRKRRLACDRDICTEGEVQDHVRSRTSRRYIDVLAGRREVDQGKSQLMPARRHFKAIASLTICCGPRLHRALGGPQLNRHAGQGPGGFVANGSDKIGGVSGADHGQ